MSQRQQIEFEGLDLSTPAAAASPGACRVLEGAVRPIGRRGWVPAAQPSAESPTGLLGTARQPREGGSRLIVLRKGSAASNTTNDRLLAVDPNNFFAETTLKTFGSADDTRSIDSAAVTPDTVIALISGSGVETPEKLLLVRGDTVTELPWPKPPVIRISWSERSGDQYVEEGEYVFRVAWRLEDGTVGPASGPILSSTGEPVDEDNGFEAEITLHQYPDGQPSSAWQDRIAGLTVIVHPRAETGTATQVSALNVPGYRVTGWESIPSTGDKIKWSDPLEGIISSDEHVTTTLVHHDPRAGALYSYNKRLVLADVEYDPEKPLLNHMIRGGGSGTDYHLTMRVRIETSQGVITRYADPIGFSTNAAQSAQLEGSLIWYRDSRALSWTWLLASDYDGSNFDSATWEEVVVPDTPNEFQEARNANFAYVEVPYQFIDLLSRSKSTSDVTSDGGWTDKLKSEREEEKEPSSNKDDSTGNNPPHDAVLDLSSAAIIGANENVVKARYEIKREIVEEEEGAGDADATATITVSVQDSNGNKLDSQTFDAPMTVDSTQWVELDNFDPAKADQLRVETDATASATASGDDYAHAKGLAEAKTVEIDIADAGAAATTVSTDRSGDHAETDRDPNRIVWSEPLRPLDLRVENLTFAGDHDQDGVMALASNARPVSEGQYGQYPIIALCQESIWALEVGSGSFVQAVTPIATDQGLVGRHAVTEVGQSVVAATQRGIVELRPNVDAVLSKPLHDPGKTFLGGLDAETRVDYYTDQSQGRRELWVTHGSETYVFSIDAASWSTLDQTRDDLARVGEQLYGVDGSGTLQSEGAGTASNTVSIETVATGLSNRSQLKRLRDAWVNMGQPPAKANDQYFMVRSHDETAKGLDYMTNLRQAMRLARGHVQAVSFYVQAVAGTDVTFIGVGVQFEERSPGRPLPAVTVDETTVGPNASKSDLDAEVNW